MHIRDNHCSCKYLKWLCCRLEKYSKPAKLKPMSTCPTFVKECYNTIVFTVWIIHWQINVLTKHTLWMYQTSKKKTNSRFNNLYILKLNQVDDKHQERVKFSKMRKALDFRTSETETSGPFSWNAGPSPLGASPGHPSCHLLHSQTPKIKQWEICICICQNHTAKLLLNTPMIAKGSPFETLHLLPCPGSLVHLQLQSHHSSPSYASCASCVSSLSYVSFPSSFSFSLHYHQHLSSVTNEIFDDGDKFVNRNTNDVLSINISGKYNAKTEDSFNITMNKSRS